MKLSIVGLLVVIFVALCQSVIAQVTTGSNPADWTGSYYLVCSKGRSAQGCFSLYGTTCSGIGNVLNPRPDNAKGGKASDCSSRNKWCWCERDLGEWINTPTGPNLGPVQPYQPAVWGIMGFVPGESLKLTGPKTNSTNSTNTANPGMPKPLNITTTSAANLVLHTPYRVPAITSTAVIMIATLVGLIPFELGALCVLLSGFAQHIVSA